MDGGLPTQLGNIMGLKDLELDIVFKHRTCYPWNYYKYVKGEEKGEGSKGGD